jgi:ABC-type sugar transport system substrate-binding protein
MARRLALFLMDDGSYQELLREECIASARHHSFTTRVFSADNDAEKQVAAIERCLAEPENTRPTVVMVSPVRESALRATATAATRLGVGWVLLNRWTDFMTSLYRQYPQLPVFCISADQHEVGRIQGRQFEALLPRGGELLYIRGPIGTSTVMRRFAGVQEVLASTSIRTFTVNSDWSMEGGENAMKEWLQIFQGRRKLPMLLVGAQNDSMGIGAQKALMRELRDPRYPSASHVRFTGCDGSPNHGLRWVSEGKLTATVVIPPVAGRAISEIASMLSGGPKPPEEILLRPSSFPEIHVLEKVGGQSFEAGVVSGVVKVGSPVRSDSQPKVDSQTKADSQPKVSTKRQ